MLRSDDTLDTELLTQIRNSHETTSARIRALHAVGWSRSKIAAALGKRYQHVRGVLIDDERRMNAVSPETAPRTPKASHTTGSFICDFRYLDEALKNARHAEKKALNLSINARLLEAAKQLNINLSELLERHLLIVLKQKAMARWQSENQEAVEASNQFVERHGLWSDGLRQF